MLISHCFDYCGYIICFEIKKHESFNFVLFQNYFGSLGSGDDFLLGSTRDLSQQERGYRNLDLCIQIRQKSFAPASA